MRIAYDPNDMEFIDRLSSTGFCDREGFVRRLASEKAALSDGFTRLLSVESIVKTGSTSFHLYPHQEEAVRRVLTHMNGRAILADEVGLGKTIEAGIVLKEYVLRGMVRRALILVPASLVSQWRGELGEMLKFDLAIGRAADDFNTSDFVIASIDLAKRARASEIINQRTWDMVIVDEAHRLKDRTTRNWRFVNSIQKTYLLLLTATPIQNDLRELYNLVTLLKPGQLRTLAQFKRYYMLDKHQPKNTVALKEALYEVMIRTSRKEAGILQSRRHVRSFRLNPSQAERVLYNVVLERAKEEYTKVKGERRNILPLIHLLRQLASHPMTAISSKSQLSLNDLADDARSFVPVKLLRLRQLISRLIGGSQCESVIVFTQFLNTQREISRMVKSLGHRVWTFHGQLNNEEKENTIIRFKSQGGVLVSTDAGSEGRNLQFCRVVINYDLPWNPMKIEQRIGRVHRLGQQGDVRIFNLVTTGTIEDHILYLLEKKVNMFEKVIGEMDAILSRVEGGFGGRVAHAALGSVTSDQLKRKMNQIGEELARAETAFKNEVVQSATWLEVVGGTRRT